MTVVDEIILGMVQKIKVNNSLLLINIFILYLVVTIQGPISRQSEYTITMRDLFAPWIPW
jgi:hypothetical protein